MSKVSRRSLLAGGSAFTIVKPELVRGAGQETIKVGLVGCGGRGTQAVVNLMHADANVELVAMGDIFEDKLEGSLRNLRSPEYVRKNLLRAEPEVGERLPELVNSITGRIKVDPEHHFVSFDAFKKVIASDIDLVMLATPPGYRPAHFEAVVNAGKHCWATKPIATDPVGCRRFMDAVKLAEKKKLCVNGGTPLVSSQRALETKRKVKSGAIGDILSIQNVNHSGIVLHIKEGRDPTWGDMEWQHREWYSYVWICGDILVEQSVHWITFANWMMDSHPERVVSSGGAAWKPREEKWGNIYDHHDSNFLFPDGTHMYNFTRHYPPGSGRGPEGNFFLGSKGKTSGTDLSSAKDSVNHFVQEHVRMTRAIRGDDPYLNEGMVVAEGTMTCIMAREAAYSGLEVTWDMIMNSKQDLQPKQFGYGVKMDPPPLPVPGEYKFI